MEKQFSLRKNDAMKTVFPFIAAALLAPACPLLEPALKFDDTHHPGDTLSSVIRRDTVFLVSAVSFPESYDWQRDTAFGAVSCTVELYENDKCVLSLPAGPSKRISPAPDRHHIIDGALYSDFCDRSGTVIKCNGVTAAEWEEQEIIIGLLPLDGTLYTLGRPVSGDGFSFRRNGIPVLESDTGVPFGGFGMDTYGSNGALYRDKGQICFSFHEGNSAYLVRNGTKETIETDPDARYLDAKVFDGIPAVLLKHYGFADLLYDGYYTDYAFGGSVDWLEAGIFMHGREPMITGRVALGPPGKSTFGVLKDGDYTNLGQDTGHIYFENGDWYPLKTEGRLRDEYYFFNRDCAVRIGGRFVVALTPHDGGSPVLLDGSDTLEYKLHGYLSGVAAEIREHHAD